MLIDDTKFNELIVSFPPPPHPPQIANPNFVPGAPYFETISYEPVIRPNAYLNFMCHFPTVIFELKTLS